jgi:hypothetical protein
MFIPHANDAVGRHVRARPHEHQIAVLQSGNRHLLDPAVPLLCPLDVARRQITNRPVGRTGESS